MSAVAITKALQKMRESGFILTLVRERLDVETPNGLTDEQRDFIRLHKAALVEELKAESIAPTAPTPAANDDPPLLSSPSHHWRNHVTCGDCCHFSRRVDHPFLGHCAKGMPERLVGLRSDFKRFCDAFEAHTKADTSIGVSSSAPATVNTAVKPMVCTWDYRQLITRCDKPDIYDDANYQVIGCRNCGSLRQPKLE